MGKRVVTAKISRENGKETKKEILKSQMITKPVKKIVVKGTKKLPKTAPTGTFITVSYTHLTSGLHRSDLVIIAARPAMGKTAFVLNIAQNTAVKSGATAVSYTHLDVYKRQIQSRMLNTAKGPAVH